MLGAHFARIYGREKCESYESSSHGKTLRLLSSSRKGRGNRRRPQKAAENGNRFATSQEHHQGTEAQRTATAKAL
jgi:hypothetical protein